MRYVPTTVPVISSVTIKCRHTSSKRSRSSRSELLLRVIAVRRLCVGPALHAIRSHDRTGDLIGDDQVPAHIIKAVAIEQIGTPAQSNSRTPLVRRPRSACDTFPRPYR